MPLLLAFALILILIRPVHATPRYGMIDPSGRWIIRPSYQSINQIGNGFCIATNFDRTKTLFDLRGVELSFPIPPNCTVVNAFMQTSANVKTATTNPRIFLVVLDKTDSKIGVIDASGNFILPLDHRQFETFSDGYFFLSETVDKPDVEGYRRNFTTTFFIVDEHGRQCGCISKDTFAPTLEHFREGVFPAMHCRSGKYSFFDTTGKKLDIPPQTNPAEFSEGFIVVSKQMRPLPYPQSEVMCFLDKKGQKLGNRDFDYCFPFIGGFAVVGQKHKGALKFGVIDTQGKVRIPIIYNYISHIYPSDFFAERMNHYWFALDIRGRVLRRFPKLIQPLDTYDGGIDCLIHTKLGRTLAEDKRAILDKKGRLTDLNVVSTTTPAVKVVWTKQDEMLFGLRNNKGWLVRPDFCHLLKVSDDRFIAAVEPKSFTSDEWKYGPQNDGAYSRAALFFMFLKAYDLIDMPEAKLIRLLGDEGHQERGYNYRFSCGSCGMTNQHLSVECENKRVKRWCFGGNLNSEADPRSSDYQWHYTNVVYIGKRQDSIYDAKNWVRKGSM